MLLLRTDRSSLTEVQSLRSRSFTALDTWGFLERKRRTRSSERASADCWSQWCRSLVLQIPGVGKVKAMQLLQRFPSIHQLCGASVYELEPIVGQATTQHITAFFHNQFT
uniref:DisA/LigA helix-hairpin-helix motif domain-containing protein n=1 Tax=Cyprinus carpio TaxID=7962 RepID=A0A8C1R743_CYPCA